MGNYLKNFKNITEFESSESVTKYLHVTVPANCPHDVFFNIEEEGFEFQVISGHSAYTRTITFNEGTQNEYSYNETYFLDMPFLTSFFEDETTGEQHEEVINWNVHYDETEIITLASHTATTLSAHPAYDEINRKFYIVDDSLYPDGVYYEESDRHFVSVSFGFCEFFSGAPNQVTRYCSSWKGGVELVHDCTITSTVPGVGYIEDSEKVVYNPVAPEPNPLVYQVQYYHSKTPSAQYGTPFRLDTYTTLEVPFEAIMRPVLDFVAVSGQTAPGWKDCISIYVCHKPCPESKYIMWDTGIVPRLYINESEGVEHYQHVRLDNLVYETRFSALYDFSNGKFRDEVPLDGHVLRIDIGGVYPNN